MATRRGFGVAGGLDPDIVRRVASAAEAAGYATLWANDTPSGDGLLTLAVAGDAAPTIGLAVGVVPVDRQAPDRIVARVRELGLPLDRLTIGIGAGGTRTGALDLVRRSTEAIQSALGVPVLIGALGPRMRELAGTVADGVLLNWLTPAEAARSGSSVRAAAAGRARPPRIVAYVRTALGEAAQSRLTAEAERYERFPQYARHFARMGVPALDTAVTGTTRSEIQAGLAAFEACVDEAVVRAIVGQESTADYLELLAAAAPLGFDPSA